MDLVSILSVLPDWAQKGAAIVGVVVTLLSLTQVFLVGLAAAASQVAGLLPAGAGAVALRVASVLSGAGQWCGDAAPNVAKLGAWLAGFVGKRPGTVAVVASLVLASQLTACNVLKPIARTAVDLAADLCVAHYTEAQGVSTDEALAKFCTTETALRPWLDELLRAKEKAAKAARGGAK